MLIVALILVAVAIILFALDALKIAQPLISAGLAFFAGGIAAWLIDILHSQGKL